MERGVLIIPVFSGVWNICSSFYLDDLFFCLTNVLVYTTNDSIWVAFCLISERLLCSLSVVFDSRVDNLGNILIFCNLMDFFARNLNKPDHL